MKKDNVLYIIDKEHYDPNKVNACILGFWVAILSALFYICFDVVAVSTITGALVSKYWISIWMYTPSLFSALSFVILSITIHYYAGTERKIWSHIGIVLAVMYATLNCFIYITQISIIAPSFINGQFAHVAIFEVAPGKPLYAVNALAYSLMGLSTMFLALVFKKVGIENWVRIVLLLHGVMAPAIVGVILWPSLIYISASVGITYPLAAILLAILFWQKKRQFTSGICNDYASMIG